MNTKDRKRVSASGRPARRKASAAKKPRAQSQVQILYTPAKPFNRNRFLLRLATVAAVVLALVFGMSIFFKARKITVSGTEKYTPWEVREASGIQESDGLFGVNETQIGARIRSKLPYIRTVRVGIKLPDTVNIEVTEMDAVYAVEDDQTVWWLMDARGRIVEKTSAAASKGYTRITGVKIQNAAVGETALAAEPEAEESTDPSQTDPGTVGATVPTVFPQLQLEAALQITAALESNGIMGTVETVNVSDVKQLYLWYGDRYQVLLGDTGRLEYKIGAMKAAVQKMGEYQSGYLDVSFTTWPDQVGYTPFEEETGK